MKNLKDVKALTSLEVAEMMEMPHSEILKKLEGTNKADGTTKQLGIIQVFNEGKIPVVDYFMKSTYLDAKGEERPCYLITKLGCDFLANKFNGRKGILFTARYVKKFYEMEDQLQGQTNTAVYAPKATSLGEIASYIKVESKVLEKNGAAPWEIADMSVKISQQFGLDIATNVVKKPMFEQINLLEKLHLIE